MFPHDVGATVTQVLVTVFDEAGRLDSARIAGELRRAGTKTEVWYDLDGLGKQLKYAAAKGIPFALIIGPDEMAAHEVTLRDLATGEQIHIKQEELPQALKARLAAA
jgi:histidyl-tRNA synthetase